MKAVGRISIAAAAKRLTENGDAVDRSTLSRYLKQHAEALPLERAGKANLVDYEDLAKHRSENIRLSIRPSTRAQATHGGEGHARPTQIAGNARKANAEAELKEMELAQRRKELAPVTEVDHAARDAVALMTSAFDRSVEAKAASLSVRYGWDERTARLALKEFARESLDIFHRHLLERIDAIRRQDIAASPIDDHALSFGLQ